MISFICRVEKKSTGFNNFVVYINESLKEFPTKDSPRRVVNFQTEDIDVGFYYIVWSAEITKDSKPKECIAKEFVKIPETLYKEIQKNTIRSLSTYVFDPAAIVNQELFPKDIAPSFK